MADSIYATGGSFGNDSYVKKQSFGLDGFADTIYIGVQVYVPSATLTSWATDTAESPWFLQMQRASGAFINGDFFYDNDFDNVYDVWEDYFFGDVAAALPDGAWRKFEWQLEPTNGPGPEKIWVEEALIVNNTFGPGSPSNPIDRVLFGPARNTGTPSDGDVYLGEIRIGTVFDGFDLFHFLPATAPDLSAFDAVVGTVALASAPVAPPAWSTPAVLPIEGVAIAFDDGVLVENPTWTRLDV